MTNPSVTMVLNAYRRPDNLRVMLACLQAQTMPSWEAIVVVEDGYRWDHGSSAVLDEYISDPRIRRLAATRAGDWGHAALEFGTKYATGDWIGHSCDDNYYVPAYFETMIRAAEEAEAGFVYCDMLHHRHGYQRIVTRPEPCQIDRGGWLCRREIVQATEWPEKAHPHGDGFFAQRLAGKTKVAKVNQVLYVHN